MRPVYEELLHAASRFNLSPTAELKRPTSNLVKIASHVKAKPGDAVIQGDQHTTMTDSPIVLRELYAREVTYRDEHKLWFDAPAGASDTDRLISQRSEAVKSRELHFHLGAMDAEKNLPHSLASSKLIGWTFPSMTSCSNSPLLRKEFSEAYSSKKQLVRGLVVVQKKRRLPYSSRAIAV